MREKILGGLMNSRFLDAAHKNIDQAAEGRIPEALPVRNFLLIKPEIIVLVCRLKRVMFRMMRLHEDLAFRFPPAGAPGDLRQKIKGALGRPEVRQMQGHIRVHHSHESAVSSQRKGWSPDEPDV